MKKLLLTGTALAMFAAAVNAQNRLVLYEEFSGENCGPCASTNPGLWRLLTTGNNEQEILIIKYQAPIPSGYPSYPLYEQNTVDVDARTSYYSVPFAPYSRMDGAVSPGGTGSSAGHPGFLTQTHIDDRADIDAPFDMEVVSYSITGTTVTANVKVTANVAITAANLKFRATLNETLHFATPPGANGETEFHNVVRKMYPDATGQDMEDAWTAGEEHSYTISGTLPSYVNVNNEHFLTFWVQDDSDKSIKQAARTYPGLDVMSRGLTTDAATLNCGLPTTVAPTVQITNGGSTTLSSAKVYYKEAGAATWSVKDWSGTLATGASTNVALDPITLTTTGFVGIIDSVGNPNGGVDKFASNNKSGGASVTVLKDDDGIFPINENFDGTAPDWVSYANTDGYPLYRYTGTGIGYGPSNGFLHYPAYQLPTGVRGYIITPFAEVPAGPKVMDLYVAYAQYKDPTSGVISGDEKIEIVYSENCGDSWTPVWSKSGIDLATRSATDSSFIPQGNSQWALHSADVSAIPAGAQIALRATSTYGNNLFIDNVNLRSGTPTNVEELVANGSFAVYPNPVVNELTVDIDMVKAAKATINIVNVVGQVVGATINENLNTGKNYVNIPTASLAPGVYFLNITTASGNVQQKFVKK